MLAGQTHRYKNKKLFLLWCLWCICRQLKYWWTVPADTKDSVSSSCSSVSMLLCDVPVMLTWWKHQAALHDAADEQIKTFGATMLLLPDAFGLVWFAHIRLHLQTEKKSVLQLYNYNFIPAYWTPPLNIHCCGRKGKKILYWFSSCTSGVQ